MTLTILFILWAIAFLSAVYPPFGRWVYLQILIVREWAKDVWSRLDVKHDDV